MIHLFTWPTPNGIKPQIMLEETGLPYKVTGIDITKGDQFKPAFPEDQSQHKMPAIIDEKGSGGKPMSIFESGAILIYLAEKSGKLMPRPNAAPLRGRTMAHVPGRHRRADARSVQFLS